ncbi:aminoglycoside 6'-N-acetyltransferase [Salinibacillus kushneri]|uniref:Aminoglycoside 6'-N-acetyltransferase n=1 Tax=Salinibacillus kushneri TaxID=237682 RepID=A0A1H9YXZ9_9BACI|nr:NUDIX hydrolase [Salinibacillus kushneri]SES73976.1 aminoglycoside 6'-N-acetyltransferase [Salinibacillus kushneri]
MGKWYGAAGVCVKNERVLMVLQGTIDEPKRWSVPSGGIETGETFETCCVREVKEETGYGAEIVRPLFKKESQYGEVHYFNVRIVGGKPTIQDPDEIIYDVDWKSTEDIQYLSLSYEEDRIFIKDFIKKNQ